MTLTEAQVESVSFCVACQGPVDTGHARSVLEQGATPGGFYCQKCRENPERVMRGFCEQGRQLSIQIVAERIKAAGLERHFKNLAHERDMRDDNRQN